MRLVFGTQHHQGIIVVQAEHNLDICFDAKIRTLAHVRKDDLTAKVVYGKICETCGLSVSLGGLLLSKHCFNACPVCSAVARPVFV